MMLTYKWKVNLIYDFIVTENNEKFEIMHK